MKIPRGAKDWEHKVDRTHPDNPYDRWLALVPNIGEIVLNVYEKASGAWCVVVLEESDPVNHPGQAPGESDLALEHAAPLPTGPFASAKDAMRAADQWCIRWAPRLVDLPGVYALRICTDGKIRVSADESDADHCDEMELTPDEAQALMEVLSAAVAEASAQQKDCPASPIA